MARVDEIPIDACTTSATLADVCEISFCCSSARDALSDHYPNIVEMLASRKADLRHTRYLSRKFSTFAGRKAVKCSLALMAILTGEDEFNTHIAEFYRPFTSSNSITFDNNVFKEVVRGRTSLQRFGLIRNCVADELAMSELGSIVLENMKHADIGELNMTATEIMKLNSQNVLRHPNHMTALMEKISSSWRKGTSEALASILRFFNMPLAQKNDLEQSCVNLPGGDTLKLYTGNFLIVIQHFECGKATPKKTMIFGVDWIERLTRCLSGTLLTHFCVDLPFFCLKTNNRDIYPSTILNFEGETDWINVKGEKRFYSAWRRSMKPLVNHLEVILNLAAEQNSCDDSKFCLNKAAGSMKKLWVALMAKQKEDGEEAISTLSERDYLDLKNEAAKEGGPLLIKWSNILEEIERDWDLQPFDILNLARCYVLFPIGSYTLLMIWSRRLMQLTPKLKVKQPWKNDWNTSNALLHCKGA